MRTRPNVVACLLALGVASCVERRSLLPDYAELLSVGVDPATEAEEVERTLGAVGLATDERTDGAGFVALGLGRPSDGHRAVRVVTTRGVVYALDSGGLDPAGLVGDVHLRPETGTDVDGDGRRDVVVERREAGRSCWLVLALTDDGGLEALRVDAVDLEPDACLEGFEDVDGHVGVEALVRVRMPSFSRTRVATVVVPLERDEGGAYRRRPPAVAFLARVRDELEAAIERARASRELEESYTLAIEAALVAREAGESRELQLRAFDDAVGGVVWSEELAGAVRSARARIERGWD